MVQRVCIALVLLVGSAVQAAPCQPSVHLLGEQGLVGTVAELLVQHGVANEGERCPSVRGLFIRDWSHRTS